LCFILVAIGLVIVALLIYYYFCITVIDYIDDFTVAAGNTIDLVGHTTMSVNMSSGCRLVIVAVGYDQIVASFIAVDYTVAVLSIAF
jgi:hypothetical protein